MANELTVSVSLSFSKGRVTASISKAGLQVNVSGTNYTRLIQNVGTSQEQLLFGDVSTPGYCVLINRDPTNYIEVRPATGVADLIQLDPNDGVALFKFAADCTAPFVIANTAGCELEILLIEA
jgi:hypothetical protein